VNTIKVGSPPRTWSSRVALDSAPAVRTATSHAQGRRTDALADEEEPSRRFESSGLDGGIEEAGEGGGVADRTRRVDAADEIMHGQPASGFTCAGRYSPR
jgi:hypothetical protein